MFCCNFNQRRTAVQRKTKEELLKMAPEDLFMELIRDIANELNVNQLCHKILVNVCVLVSKQSASNNIFITIDGVTTLVTLPPKSPRCGSFIFIHQRAPLAVQRTA